MERVLAVVLFILFVLTPVLFIVESGSETLEIYAGKGPGLVVHDPIDPAYLSIADGYLIPRIKILKALDVASGVLIANGVEYPLKLQLETSSWRIYYATVPLDRSVNGLNYYFRLTLSNETLVYVYNTDTSRFYYFNGSMPFKQVEWIRDRVGYQIFPDRFYNGNPGNDLKANLTDELWINEVSKGTPVFTRWNGPVTPLHCCHQYFGGDLKGITEKLDYLKELGVGLIYLNPIFTSGSVHGYDVYDYYTVDPKFGTLDDLMMLLNEAHKRGIRVIFDFVPDHVGLGFWAFQDVYRNGPSSRYWSWFIIYKWPFKPGDSNAYKCWWGIGSLPQLNVLNKEVRQYLINVALYWLSIGFDGLRIDAPLDVIDSENFFRELREAVKSRYPDAYIVGEIWDYRPEWLRGEAFDSLMNYYLGRNILLSYARGALNGYIASARLSEYYAGIGVNVAGMGFNIIGSHDTSRILTDLGGGGLRDTTSNESIKRLKLLSTLQYTQPGMPVVFQGDERGVTGRQSNYDEQRYPIQWDRLNQEVFEHYKKLGELKNTIPALSTSIIHVLNTEGSILAYTRGYNDEVLVVANNALEPIAYKLPKGNWSILYVSSGENVEVDNGSITVPPLTAIILVEEQSSTTSNVTQHTFTQTTNTTIQTTTPSNNTGLTQPGEELWKTLFPVFTAVTVLVFITVVTVLIKHVKIRVNKNI